MIGQAAHDGGHVKLGFANARNAARADHAAGAGIVGGERLLEIAIEPVELFAQVTRAAFEIGEGIVGIDAKVAGGARH